MNSKTDRSVPPLFMNTAFIPHVSNAHVLMSIAYLTLNISFAPATYAPNDLHLLHFKLKLKRVRSFKTFTYI